MNKLNVVLVDDSSDARDALRGLLDLFCENVTIVGEGHDIATAQRVIIDTQPDLVFLDVDLNGEHGFDLLPLFNPPPFHVIFSTGLREYAADAFRVNAIDYLIKPIDPDELEAAVAKVKKLEKQEKIAVMTSEERHLIDIQKIIRVEGSGSYSTFFIENEPSIMASKNLKHYEDLLDSNLFLRSHQSHLVNLNFIKTLSNKNILHLKNGDEVPVSRGNKKEVTDVLNKFFES